MGRQRGRAISSLAQARLIGDAQRMLVERLGRACEAKEECLKEQRIDHEHANHGAGIDGTGWLRAHGPTMAKLLRASTGPGLWPQLCVFL